MISRVYWSGPFGQLVAERLRATHPAVVAGPLAGLDAAPPTGGVSLVALSSARFSELERVGAVLHPHPWLATFLLGANLVVSPLFRPGGVCQVCFCRRMLSNPPPPLQQEVLAALTAFCDRTDDYTQEAFPPMTPRVAGELAWRHARQAGNYASVWNLAGLSASSAPIVPLHACACRTAGEWPAGPDRFIQFHAEAVSWLR